MISYNEFEKPWTICEQKWTPAVEKKNDARTTLLTFTQQTKPNYRANWHHEHLAKMLDRVATGSCRRLMVFMPPQHGKSELVSRRFPAYMLGRNPDLRLVDQKKRIRRFQNGSRRITRPRGTSWSTWPSMIFAETGTRRRSRLFWARSLWRREH